MTRCKNREFYFLTPEDFQILLAHLSEPVCTYAVALYAYARTSNPVHLFLRAPETEARGAFTLDRSTREGAAIVRCPPRAQSISGSRMPTENSSQRDLQRQLDAWAGEGAPPSPGEPEQNAPDSAAGATLGIPVVGLGGSAGALEPFRRFLAALPAESGAVFVVIQHLAPTHQSLLPELLAQHTRMRVLHAQDAVPVAANCVYVIPPDKYLGIRDGILYLTEPVAQSGIRMSIDFFFRALAEDRQERAVGILFSGAGSDGTLGVRAVRGAGGLTIAQDPQSAQFGEMPRSAMPLVWWMPSSPQTGLRTRSWNTSGNLTFEGGSRPPFWRPRGSPEA